MAFEATDSRCPCRRRRVGAEHHEVAVRERPTGHGCKVSVADGERARQPVVERDVWLVVKAHRERPVRSGRRCSIGHKAVHLAIIQALRDGSRLMVGVERNAGRRSVTWKDGVARCVGVRVRGRNRIDVRLSAIVELAEQMIEAAILFHHDDDVPDRDRMNRGRADAQRVGRERAGAERAVATCRRECVGRERDTAA